MQTAQNFEQFRRQAMHISLHRSALTSLAHHHLDLLARFGNHIFDARGVNATVEDELIKRDTRHLTPNGIETGKNDSFWSIINDEINAGCRLKRADVAPLTSDNSPFHLFVGQLHHRDYGFGYLVRGTTLDRQRNNLAGTCLGLLPRLLFNQACPLRSFLAYLALDLV